MHQTKLCSHCGKPCHYDIGLVLPETILCAPCDDRQHAARLAARAAAAQTYTLVKTNGEQSLRIRTFDTLAAAGECVDRLETQLHLTPGYRYVIEIEATQ